MRKKTRNNKHARRSITRKKIKGGWWFWPRRARVAPAPIPEPVPEPKRTPYDSVPLQFNSDLPPFQLTNSELHMVLETDASTRALSFIKEKLKRCADIAREVNDIETVSIQTLHEYRLELEDVHMSALHLKGQIEQYIKAPTYMKQQVNRNSYREKYGNTASKGYNTLVNKHWKIPFEMLYSLINVSGETVDYITNYLIEEAKSVR